MKTWKIDPIHSEIKFKVKHLLVSTVTGKFDSFDASIEAPDNAFTDAKISFEADVNSINTGNEMRDGHLKSPDFFDAASHPKMTFVSKSLTKKNENEYELKGNMTIRGTTKEITLNVIYNGTAKGMDGTDVAGFEITGKINRFDYGLHWNALTETGGFAVGSDVKLEIFAEMKNVLPLGKAA
ncbi:MAG TPA: YceI family protein [Ignavibacteria bacterium]|jgi:polyisoprenoid-binding protein YceI